LVEIGHESDGQALKGAGGGHRHRRHSAAIDSQRRGIDVTKSSGLRRCATVPCAQARRPPMSSDLIKHITDDSFDSDVLAADKPVLVDYWAEWCGPCKAIAPILDEVSKDYEGRVQIAKMNVDENREVPGKFGIRGIPTLMLFKGGQLTATKVGALTKAQLTAFLDGHL
jgi:thioredoxin 1